MRLRSLVITSPFVSWLSDSIKCWPNFSLSSWTKTLSSNPNRPSCLSCLYQSRQLQGHIDLLSTSSQNHIYLLPDFDLSIDTEYPKLGSLKGLSLILFTISPGSMLALFARCGYFADLVILKTLTCTLTRATQGFEMFC